MDVFTRIVPFGDFYKKAAAEEIIRREVSDNVMRRKMLRLLALIPAKKSVYLAQQEMSSRNMDEIMERFARLNLSPVTISKLQEVTYLQNLYEYLGEF